MKYKLHYDYMSCIGCETCERVCGVIHVTPRVHLYRVQGGIPVPVGCRHCEKAPCIRICPEEALYRDDDGFVVLDESKCIGCLMCIISCPFGAIDLDTINKVVVKCTGCSELRERGLRPACEAMCPAEAIYFGTPDEIFDKIRRKFAEKMASDHSRER